MDATEYFETVVAMSDTLYNMGELEMAIALSRSSMIWYAEELRLNKEVGPIFSAMNLERDIQTLADCFFEGSALPF